jgi:hypothetical protein
MNWAQPYVKIEKKPHSDSGVKSDLYICHSSCRCSPAFFEEERAALEIRRTKIRLLQQRKMSELQTFKDLPEEIPMHLVIGTKVTGKTVRFCYVSQVI